MEIVWNQLDQFLMPPPTQGTRPMPLLPPPVDATVSDCSSDVTYDIRNDAEDVRLEEFVEDWVLSLSRDDMVSLGLFLSFHLENLLGFSASNAAEYAAIMLGKSDRTVRQWKADFIETGDIPDSQQGRHQRNGVLWSSEELNKKALKYVRENSNVKGMPNLTVSSFCFWLNNELLPNSCLEPGFPRNVSIETARKWLHQLGFEVLSSSKGLYFDGHEREDVVKERHHFLRKMIELGFLHPEQAPTPEAEAAFPKDVPLTSTEVREKSVFFFHDESTFNSNEDQSTQWGEKGQHMLKPKSKGSGIMVSDFVDERHGYLALTNEEYEQASKDDPAIRKKARRLLAYGENREGYWTCEKFIQQLEEAVKICEYKYPKADGWRWIWIFDQSSCHTAMAEDALDVSRMNVGPGGKQPKMRDTVWAGKPQKMCFVIGVPKGMKIVLEERGINTSSLLKEDMQQILRNHEDFRNEMPRIVHFLEERGHVALFLPKFHPELNPIERVWAQSKVYTKAHCKYTFPSLRNTIPIGLDTVTLENIQKYHRKARDYMFAYFQGFVAGPKLEEQVKLYKSHRRVGTNS